MSKWSNSYGNDKRGMMRFLRENGIAPTVANLERIQREVSRNQTENERVVAQHKELERTKGIPATRDEKGDVHARVRRAVKRDMDSRGQR